MEAVKTLVLQRVEGLSCLCDTVWRMVDCEPPLTNKTDHVILRHDGQWSAMLGHEMVPVLAMNARNELLPSHDTVISKTHSLFQSLASLTGPQADVLSGRFAPVSLLHHQIIQDTCDRIYELVWSQTSNTAATYPWLSEDTANEAREALRTLRIVGGCWDKMTHRQYGMCDILLEQHTLDSVLFGKKFALWGWGDTPAMARALALHEIISNARTAGVIQDAWDAGVCRKCFLTEEATLTWLQSEWLPHNEGQGESTNLLKSPVAAPTLFDLLKWKCNEHESKLLKYRTGVSYKNHPLQSYSRVISRCLQRGLEELMIRTPVLGFPGMLGVRDLIFAARRVGATPGSLELKELDMDDMFWEIPQTEVIASVRWLISTLRARNKKPVPKQTRQTSQQTLDVTPAAPLGVEALWFSISKSGDKSLDRVGKAAGKDFRMITAEQIIRFLQFNMKGNTLLVAGRVLLQQGQRGVPIGEFLSAQLAEIWAAWKEFSKLFATSDDTNNFAADVTSALHQVCTCSVPSVFSDQLTERSLCMKCNACQTSFTLAQECDFTMAPHQAAHMVPHGPVMRAPDVHTATMDQVCDSGFTGLWSASELPVAFLNIADTMVTFARTTHWDGGVGGRIRPVIEHTPRRDRAYARTFLQTLDPLQAVMGELLTPAPWASPGDQTGNPLVLMSRYRDNIYLSLCNIPPHVRTQVLHALQVMLRQIYGIPLKWEPHTDRVVWGEAQAWSTGTEVHLTRKGIATALETPEPSTMNEWTRWVNRYSPNARTVWRSQLPSLVIKSIWYALSTTDLVANLKSLVWGLGFHRYPKNWWRPPLFRLWRKYRLERCFSMCTVDRWAQEGASLSAPVCHEQSPVTPKPTPVAHSH